MVEAPGGPARAAQLTAVGHIAALAGIPIAVMSDVDRVAVRVIAVGIKADISFKQPMMRSCIMAAVHAAFDERRIEGNPTVVAVVVGEHATSTARAGDDHL